MCFGKNKPLSHLDGLLKIEYYHDFVILFGFQDVICVEKFTIINKNILPKSMFQRCITQVRRCILQLKNSVYVFRLESDNSEVINRMLSLERSFRPLF